MVGGVCSQTNLKITGGVNWNGYPGPRTEEGTSWNPSNDGEESGLIQFHDNTPKNCRVGGKGWATAYTGTPQTFTVTLNNYFLQRYNDNPETNLASNFVLVAVKGGVYSGNDLETYNDNNWNGNDFKNGDGTSTLKVVATTGAQSTFTNNQLVLELEVNEAYDAVYLYHSGDGGYKYIKVESIVRTEGASVAAPTITPASGTYDGDLTVTITKGDGNAKVVYSVSGATTGNATDAEFTGSSKVLNLTGTGTITVTATGYDGEDNASSDVTNTYTYSIPSGQSSTTSGLPHTFNSWDGGNSITFNNSFFSNIETGDYVVFDVANVAQNGTVLGFRDSWNESPYVDCTTTSGGNGAKGTLNIGDTQWWMKVNSDVVNSLKNHEVRMQGGMVPKETAGTESDVTSSVDLTSIKVYKSKGVSESLDNSLTKINDVVVELTRSFVAGTWNTVCLPFALTSAQATQLFGSGYQLAAFTSVSGSTMEFTTTDDFDAGVPYLVKPTINVSNASPVVLVDIDITAKTPQTVTFGDYSFVGTFTGKTFSGSECAVSRFVATENKLKTPKENSTMKALRAYFTVPSSSNNARSFNIDGVEDEATTTSINEEAIVKGATSPTMIYNLAGQRVSQPTKGLYIVNGKKIVMNK